jgi:hypothetical protein
MEYCRNFHRRKFYEQSKRSVAETTVITKWGSGLLKDAVVE